MYTASLLSQGKLIVWYTVHYKIENEFVSWMYSCYSTKRMTDIESMLLNDVPYLNALDSSESAARSLYKKYALPDIRYVYM